MQHAAGFNRGLHCLQKYSFRGFRMKRVNQYRIVHYAFFDLTAD